MSKSTFNSLILLLFVIQSAYAADQKRCIDDENATFEIVGISVSNMPIFDETAADAISLHRLANSLHINTKPAVVMERLPFAQGDKVTQTDIVEAEALLRAQRYLANAEITLTPDCENNTAIVNITTWDNWSLIPTLSFGRSGGENRSTIGVRDDNLLGLGIRAAVRYSEDEQRSGYQFFASSPVPGIRHANLSLGLADNDDGEVYSITFDMPFYHFNTQNSLFAQGVSLKETEDMFQNNQTRNSFNLEQEKISLSRGWQLSSKQFSVKRLSLGISWEKSDFEVAPESPSGSLLYLPENRDLLFPWIGFEYSERDIMVMHDIYLINQPEDINLGWQFNARLGVDIDNEENGVGVQSHLSLKKGLAFEKSLLMFSAEINTITNTDITDYLRLDASTEYFYRTSPQLGYYARLNSTFSSGQFLDQPIVIDDDNGVRGFSNQYQHGDHRVSASAELRWYSDYNIYQLFELGFATFIDVGRAWSGDLALLNEDEGWLSSIGIGARLYSNKASTPGVVHFDITKPFSDGENVDSWEWGIQFRRAF